MISLVIQKFNLFKNREAIFQFFVLWVILFFVCFSCSTAYKDITDKGKYTVPVASGIVTERKYERSDINENNYYLKLNTSHKFIKVTEEVYNKYSQGSQAHLVVQKNKYAEGLYPLIIFSGIVLMFFIFPLVIIIFIFCFLIWGLLSFKFKNILTIFKRLKILQE